jgi:hypothetical protein
MATIMPIEDTMFWISFSVLSTSKRGNSPRQPGYHDSAPLFATAAALALIKAAIDLYDAGGDRRLPCLEFHITDHLWTGLYLWINLPMPPRRRILFNVKINATMLHDSFAGCSDAGKCPNIDSSSSLAQFLDRHIVGRVPEGVNGLHRGKLKHNHRSRVMLAFQHLDLCTSRSEFSTKASDEGNDCLTVLPILGVVRNGGLNNKICRHRRTLFHIHRAACGA